MDEVALNSWLRGRRILLTGAGGALGRALVKRIGGRAELLRLLVRRPQPSRPCVELWLGDITDPASLRDIGEGCDTLIHLASHVPLAGVADPENQPQHQAVTVDGTHNLLVELAVSGVERRVFASSIRAATPKMNLYARSKEQAEQLMLAAAERTTVVRFPAFYGQGHGAIEELGALLAKGRWPPLPDFGDRRSFIHVEDAAQAILLTAASDDLNGEIFTATDLQAPSLRQITDLLRRQQGLPPQRLEIPLWLVHWLARGGDLLQRFTGRSVPLNSRMLAKLMEDTWFDGETFAKRTGFKPAHRLVDTQTIGEVG